MKPLKLRNRYFTKELLLTAGLICFMTTNSAKAQDKQTMEDINQALADAQTVDYCEVIDHPQKFNNRMIRVRALYETAFEKSARSLLPAICRFQQHGWIFKISGSTGVSGESGMRYRIAI